jgi:hypothetical protein
VRELAGHDYHEAQRVLDWPLREAVLAYSDLMKRQAAEDYRFQFLAWTIRTAFSGGSQPPEIPAILREEK